MDAYRDGALADGRSQDFRISSYSTGIFTVLGGLLFAGAGLGGLASFAVDAARGRVHGASAFITALVFFGLFAAGGALLLLLGIRSLRTRLRITKTRADLIFAWHRGATVVRTERFGVADVSRVYVERKAGNPPGLRWSAGRVYIRLRQEWLFRLVVATSRGDIPLDESYDSGAESTLTKLESDLNAFLGGA